MSDKIKPQAEPIPATSTPSENHLAPYLLGLAMRAAGKKHNQPDLVRAGAEAVLKHQKFVKKP